MGDRRQDITEVNFSCCIKWCRHVMNDDVPTSTASSQKKTPRSDQFPMRGVLVWLNDVNLIAISPCILIVHESTGG